MIDSMELNDFRVVTTASVYKKGGAVASVSGVSAVGGRNRFTLGEMPAAQNIDLDVNIGAGVTRIRLKEVPTFIVHAFNKISRCGLEVDGIFRKEGNSARLNRPEVLDIYRGICDIPGEYTVIDVCSMVKRFLRDLKPPLLNSEEFRDKLMKKACQARISNNFTLSREEMTELFYREDQKALLSEVHFSTLAYIMRQLVRISVHSDKHKMSIDNLAVVLISGVFGDRVHDQKKGSHARRCSQDDILARKKQDMDVHTAAVKLLIKNADLIGIKKNAYIASRSGNRSSSAMPRCSSIVHDATSSDGDMTSTTASSCTNEPNTNHRRQSEAVHKIVTARKKSESNTKKKRSSSFLPSFRDIRHKLSNIKRVKSPSPERMVTGGHEIKSEDVSSSKAESFEQCSSNGGQRQKKVARNESTSYSTNSTSSGRQSRSQQSRRGNTNAMGRRSRETTEKPPTLVALFDTAHSSETNQNQEHKVTAKSQGPLRRLSQSEQNTELIRIARRMSNDEKMDVIEFLMSCQPKEENRKNVPALSRNDSFANDSTNQRENRRVDRDRRHTAPVNNGLRRHRPNTVGGGLPRRRATLLNRASSDEKENQNTETDDDDDELNRTLIEARATRAHVEEMALRARLRRAEKKQRKHVSTESMKVLNGSIIASSSSGSIAEPVQDVNENKVSTSTLVEVKDEESTVVSPIVLRKDLEAKKKEFCDIATSPMLFENAPIKSDHENGHVWVGTKQVVNCINSPTIARRSRLSYAQANESPIDMPPRRESSPLTMSPVMRHVTVTNNSPPAQVITAKLGNSMTLPRTSNSPRFMALTPPPIPPHSPPILTPQPSASLINSDISPKVPMRATSSTSNIMKQAIDKNENSPTSAMFKMPTLPVFKKPNQPLSPLARQPHSMVSLATTGRVNLRETKSIDSGEPLIGGSGLRMPMGAPMSASYTSDGKGLSPRSTEYFGFGKYNGLLRSADCDLNLPSRRQPIDARPSVAIIRTNNCGLVRSRVNQFQEIEQLSRNETAMSGRMSAMSQLSLRSCDTQQSNDRLSDVSERMSSGADTTTRSAVSSSASQSSENAITPTYSRPSHDHRST